MEVLGDLHSNFSLLQHRIKYGPDKHIFQVGDFGIGFQNYGLDNSTMKYISDLLKQYDKYLYVIRGNHDNPVYFQEPYTTKWTRILLIPDVSVVEIEEKNILCIGGATSIDRDMLIEDVDWWPNEVVTVPTDRLEDCLRVYKIDVVITHSAPNFAYPIGLNLSNWISVSEKLANSVMQDRMLLTMVYDKLKEAGQEITHWIYGHYHMDNTEERDGVNFICLGKGSHIKI